MLNLGFERSLNDGLTRRIESHSGHFLTSRLGNRLTWVPWNGKVQRPIAAIQEKWTAGQVHRGLDSQQSLEFVSIRFRGGGGFGVAEFGAAGSSWQHFGFASLR